LSTIKIYDFFVVGLLEVWSVEAGNRFGFLGGDNNLVVYAFDSLLEFSQTFVPFWCYVYCIIQTQQDILTIHILLMSDGDVQNILNYLHNN
jgi:lysylphosphatidylglycerol synthetase-like protein (DUF2156 family)